MSDEERDTGRRRRLALLGIARADIESAIELCGSAMTSGLVEGTPPYWAYSTSVVITYARPFKDNRGVGALSEKWGRFDDASLQELHNLLIRMRDEVVAHADLKGRPVYLYGPGPLPGGGRTDRPIVGVQRVGLKIAHYPFVRALCLDLHARLTRAFNDLYLKLFGEDPVGQVELLPPYETEGLWRPPAI